MDLNVVLRVGCMAWLYSGYVRKLLVVNYAPLKAFPAPYLLLVIPSPSVSSSNSLVHCRFYGGENLREIEAGLQMLACVCGGGGGWLLLLLLLQNKGSGCYHITT